MLTKSSNIICKSYCQSDLTLEPLRFFSLALTRRMTVERELDTFDSILTANADLQTLIDVTQGLFSVELLFKLVTAIIEALCITFGVPVGCTPGKRLLGIKIISYLDVQPVTGSPDRVAVTGFAYVDFKRKTRF
uniref:Uncharacterized protein n=1 Tax=Meloidogyne floridensis TaxID=298350 RepID=A0A915NL94_9BILA